LHGREVAPVGSRGLVASRVLILSWEYPPIVEGGLARHVSKLSQALVRGAIETAGTEAVRAARRPA